MPTADSQPEMVTLAAVTRAIDATAAGGYDEYHEWSPSYSLADKSAVLGRLLADWRRTEQDGQAVIMAFVRTLLKEGASYPEPLAAVLVTHAYLPEVVGVVKGALPIPAFARDLLLSMKAQQIRQEEWLATLRDLAAGKKFIRNKTKTLMKALYRDIEALLAELV
jgi:hypothetical protein